MYHINDHIKTAYGCCEMEECRHKHGDSEPINLLKYKLWIQTMGDHLLDDIIEINENTNMASQEADECHINTLVNCHI